MATYSRSTQAKDRFRKSSINLSKFTRESFDLLQRDQYNSKIRQIGRYLSYFARIMSGIYRHINYDSKCRRNGFQVVEQ